MSSCESPAGDALLIYLDYHATTPCDPRVVEAMLPYFNEFFANPSSALHDAGRAAGRAVEIAREQVAGLVGADPTEIIFTSGATEACNLAILGLVRAADGTRRRIVTTLIEHKAVLEPIRWLQEEGWDIVRLPVDGVGAVDVEAARSFINENTLLVSVQAASNEIGTVQLLGELAGIARSHGAAFHSDAAQAVGKIPMDVDDFNIDLLSISGHKMCGPKGVGALFVRRRGRRIRLQPLMAGGGQEGGLRPGTHDVPGIVGLGMASEIARLEMAAEAVRVAGIRDHFERLIAETASVVTVNGNAASRLPGNSSLTFPHIPGDALILNAPELALSMGSACQQGALEPSHVLTAIGMDRDAADSTIRVGFGRFSTHSDAVGAAESLGRSWRRVQELCA